MFTLGYKVRELRLLAQLSRRELADLCGITEWAIRDIEQRGSGVRLALLAKLRRVFDTTYDELLGDSETMTREQLNEAIALVNDAIARGSKEATQDLPALIEQLHALSCQDALTEAPVRQRARSRQLQLPPPDSSARRAGDRRR